MSPGLGQDLRFAIRTLRRWPAGVAAVLCTLALTIGATTALFSVVDAVLLHPLAVRAPNSLVSIYSKGVGSRYSRSTFRLFQDIARHGTTLAGVAASAQVPLPLSATDHSEDLDVALVSNEYFSVLGVPAALGRTILPSDPATPGSNPVVVLSSPLWHRLFAGSGSAIGATIHLSGQSLTVIGVAPDEFRGTNLSDVPDLWVPISMVPLLHVSLISEPGELNPEIPFFNITARLKRGVSIATATSDVVHIAAQESTASDATPKDGAAVVVLPLSQSTTSPDDRHAFLQFVELLVSAVLLLTLLGSLNVANLLTTRAGERAQELGVRTALGAGTGRLARQLLVEGLLLAVVGGALGIAVAVTVRQLASGVTLPNRVALDRVHVGLSPSVLAFTSLVTLLTAGLFGTAPAVAASRMRVMDLLGEHRSTLRHRRGGLVVFQVAVSLTLLVGALLLLRSLQAGQHTDLGFDPRPLAAVTIMPHEEGKHADNMRLYDAIIANVTHDPAILSAAAATQIPLAPVGDTPFAPGPGNDSLNTVELGVNHIHGAFFETLGIPLIAGRVFGVQDRHDAPRVIILNQSAARVLFRGESPLGKIVHAPFFHSSIFFDYTVVGVVKDIKYRGVQDYRMPFGYVPMAQEDLGATVSLVVRSTHPADALGVLRRTVQELAPDLRLAPMPSLRPRLVAEQIDRTLAPQRFGAMLLSGFAFLALLVSAVGIYGTVSYTVARRSGEFGIRLALGAPPKHVLRKVLQETALILAAGTGAGLIGAALGTQLIRHYLLQVGRFDPFSFVSAAILLWVIALGAAIWPALRAVRIDPLSSIRR